MMTYFSDANEKYVKSNVLYGKTSNNYLHTDEACTEANRVDDTTLFNLCVKGMLVVKYNDTYYNPVMFKEETGYTSVTIATNVAASGSASVVLYSKEYTSD